MPSRTAARKTSFLFKQAQGGILDERLGIRTGMTGDLGQLRFLLGVKWTSMPVSVGGRVYAANGSGGPEPALSEAEGFPPGFCAVAWGSRRCVLTQVSVKNRREPGGNRA
jgi:hypothetical protein